MLNSNRTHQKAFKCAWKMSKINQNLSFLRRNGQLCFTITVCMSWVNLLIFFTTEKVMLKKINFLNSHWVVWTENKLFWIVHVSVFTWNMKFSKIFVEFTQKRPSRERERWKMKFIYHQKGSSKGELLSLSPSHSNNWPSLYQNLRRNLRIKMEWLKH